MPVSRRQFLARSGMAVVAGALLSNTEIFPATTGNSTADLTSDWNAFRDLFELSVDYIHMASFYIASHPRRVGEAIGKYRKQLDENPYLVVERGMFEDEYENLPKRVKKAAAEYIGGKPGRLQSQTA